MLYNKGMNCHAKGTRVEGEAKKLLIAEDYLVEQKNWNRYRSKDFFTLFDIIAIKGNEVRLIQIKSNPSDFYKARGDISRWVADNNITGIKCEVWLKENRTPWRMEWVNKPL